MRSRIKFRDKKIGLFRINVNNHFAVLISFLSYSFRIAQVFSCKDFPIIDAFKKLCLNKIINFWSQILVRYPKTYDSRAIRGSKYLKKYIKPSKSKSDRSFYCDLCKDKDRQFENLLIHVESNTHGQLFLKNSHAKKNLVETKKDLAETKSKTQSERRSEN